MQTAYVIARFEQVGGRGMAGRVASHALDDARLGGRLLDGASHERLVNMVPPLFARLRSFQRLSWGNTECRPRPRATGVLSIEGAEQQYPTPLVGQIPVVDLRDRVQVVLERFLD